MTEAHETELNDKDTEIQSLKKIAYDEDSFMKVHEDGAGA